MGHALEILILGLPLAALFWKGAQCDLSKYTINIPDRVSVQEGLCISIPCNFTYDPDDADPSYPLNGYWYKLGETARYPVVATNDKHKEIYDKTVGRFSLSEEVESGNCSLIINNAKKEDENAYYFRMDKGYKAKFSYSSLAVLRVKVTKLPNPVIQIPEKIRAGLPVNITCIALGSCSLKRPHLAWEGLLDQVTSGIPATQSNGSVDWISALNFIPSIENHGHAFTCRVTYGEGPRALYINKTVLLNVTYPPQKLRIIADVVRSNQSSQRHTVVSQLEVQKGVSVMLRCHVDGNPLPNVTWVKILQPSGTPQPILDNKLSLPNVTAQDVGKYECRAQNTEGVASVSFHLSIAYRPKLCKHKHNHCETSGNGFQCYCSICSFPAPTIQWQVDGEVLEGNATREKIQITAWSQEDMTTGLLHLTGGWEGNHHIICKGTNLKGQFFVTFFLFSSAEGMWQQKIVHGLIGGLVVFGIITLIVGAVLVCKKCQKKRKPVTDMDSYTKQKTIHGKSPPAVKGSSSIGLNSEKGKDLSPAQGKMEDNIYDVTNEPEDLHYASVTFNPLRPLPEATSEYSQTEYAEIKMP